MDNKKIVGLFLAEIIRSRNTTVTRAAEISSQVMRAMEKLRDDEVAMLHLLGELEKDFQQVVALKQTLRFGHEDNQIREFDKEIREYASELFKISMVISAGFLRDAAESTSIEKLCKQHPDFTDFLLTKTDKAPIARQFKVV